MKKYVFAFIAICLVIWSIYAYIKTQNNNKTFEESVNYCTANEWVADSTLYIGIYANDNELLTNININQIRGADTILNCTLAANKIKNNDDDYNYYASYTFNFPIGLSDTLEIVLINETKHKIHSFKNKFSPYGRKKAGECRFFHAKVDNLGNKDIRIHI